MKNIELKYKQLSIIYWLVLVCMPACIDDKIGRNEDVNGEGLAVLSLSFPQSTLAAIGNGEEKVEDVLFLAFDPLDDSFLYMKEADDMTASLTGIKIKVTLKVGTQDFYILSGAKDIIEAIYPLGIPTDGTETKATIQQALQASAVGGWNLLTDGAIPMWGETQLTIDQSNTDFTATPIHLYRMLAKITVSDAGTPATADFTLSKVHLCNYQTKGTVIPDESNWSVNKAILPTLTGDANVKGPLSYSPGETIYTFEAAAVTKADYLKNSCLVIEGSYKGSSIPSFYRVNFIEKGQTTYKPLLRNHHYEVKITKITGPGEDNLDDALRAIPIDIDAEVTAWEEKYNRDLTIDKQDEFVVNKSQLVVWGTNFGNWTDFTESIDVKSTRSWECYLSSSPSSITTPPDWISLSRQNGNTLNDQVNLTIQENMGGRRTAYIHFKTDQLTYVATVFQRRFADPNCYFVKPGGKVEFPIRLAYLVWNSSYMKTDAIDFSNQNVSFRTEVIWRDVATSNFVTASVGSNQKGDTKLTVSAPNTGLTGNAVVGLWINNVLRYSWHIWVTDYDPDANGTVYSYNNGLRDYTFMDRNLGATTATENTLTSLGFLYSWGRKDPFPGTSSFSSHIPMTTYVTAHTEEQVGTGNYLPRSMENPTIYYFDNISHYNWNPDGNNYYWADRSFDKEYFDPCPFGWRVPPANELRSNSYHITPWSIDGAPVSDISDISANVVWNNGYRFNGYWGGYYPAAGRASNTGYLRLSNVSRYGYYWTCSMSSDSYATALTIGDRYIRSAVGILRGHGNSVRCVKDDWWQ